MLAYKSINLRETRIVLGQHPVQQLIAIAYLHPHHRSHALFPALHHEVRRPHGGVDVCQRHSFIAQVHRSFDKFLDGHCAIAQTII